MTTITLRRPRTTACIATIALVVACVLSIAIAARVAVALWWLTGCRWQVSGATRWHRFTRADLASIPFKKANN